MGRSSSGTRCSSTVRWRTMHSSCAPRTSARRSANRYSTAICTLYALSLIHISPRQVASFGSDFQFDPAKKPAGAGKRCLVDCGIEENCLYSAKRCV